MNVGFKASQAAVAILKLATRTTVQQFYAEMEDPNLVDGTANERTHPCVICYFSDATEYPPFTGNYSGQLNIAVEASADDHTAEQVEAMFDEVWRLFAVDTILADLSAFAGFTAIGFTGGKQQSQQTIIDRYRRKSLVLPINCCASDITD